MFNIKLMLIGSWTCNLSARVRFECQKQL